MLFATTLIFWWLRAFILTIKDNVGCKIALGGIRRRKLASILLMTTMTVGLGFSVIRVSRFGICISFTG